MNKKELIARVRRYMGPGATGSAASAAVEAVLSSILAEVGHGSVHVPKLGTFEMRDTPARCGYSIAAGKTVTYPSTRALTFRPSTALQSVMNTHKSTDVTSRRRRDRNGK